MFSKVSVLNDIQQFFCQTLFEIKNKNIIQTICKNPVSDT